MPHFFLDLWMPGVYWHYLYWLHINKPAMSLKLSLTDCGPCILHMQETTTFSMLVSLRICLQRPSFTRKKATPHIRCMGSVRYLPTHSLWNVERI